MKPLQPITFLCLSLLSVLTLIVWAKPKTQATKAVYAKGDVRGHLNQLGQALMMYAQDYDEVLPPMQDAKKFQQLLAPYLKNRAFLTNPYSGKPFAPNARLSGKALNEIYKKSFKAKQPAIALYEATPGLGGARFVLTLGQPVMLNKDEPVWGYDGKKDLSKPNIICISYGDWPKFKATNQLP
jgi:hypothetical protein